MIPIGEWEHLPHSRNHRYDLYTDWLISKAPNNEAILLVTDGPEDMLPHTWEPLMNSIKKRGCSSEVLYEESGVRALRLDCSDKRLHDKPVNGQDGSAEN